MWTHLFITEFQGAEEYNPDCIIRHTYPETCHTYLTNVMDSDPLLQGTQQPPRQQAMNATIITPEGTPSGDRSFKSDTSPSTSCSQAGQASDEAGCTARSRGEMLSTGRMSNCQFEDHAAAQLHPPKTSMTGIVVSAASLISLLVFALKLVLHLNN